MTVTADAPGVDIVIPTTRRASLTFLTGTLVAAEAALEARQ